MMERQPGEALEARALVDRAKKVLTTRLGLSEAEAFRRMVMRSRSTRKSLRETAWAILDADATLSRRDLADCVGRIFDTIVRPIRT